jgi:hypothetical protein
VPVTSAEKRPPAAGFPDGGFVYGRNDRPEIVWHDHEGSVWVEPYSFDRMPGVADVFGADGIHVGRVDLLERFAIIDVDGRFVLRREFDRLDVPAIVLYRVPSLAG